MTLRQKAENVVRRWATRLELDHQLPNAHPLVRARSQAMALHAPLAGVVLPSEATAHGIATRSNATSAPPPAGVEEGDRIMREIGLLTDGVRVRQVLYLVDGLGYTEQEAAASLRIGRNKVRELRHQGLGAVEMLILCRVFAA